MRGGIDWLRKGEVCIARVDKSEGKKGKDGQSDPNLILLPDFIHFIESPYRGRLVWSDPLKYDDAGWRNEIRVVARRNPRMELEVRIIWKNPSDATGPYMCIGESIGGNIPLGNGIDYGFQLDDTCPRDRLEKDKIYDARFKWVGDKPSIRSRDPFRRPDPCVEILNYHYPNDSPFRGFVIWTDPVKWGSLSNDIRQHLLDENYNSQRVSVKVVSTPKKVGELEKGYLVVGMDFLGYERSVATPSERRVINKVLEDRNILRDFDF